MNRVEFETRFERMEAEQSEDVQDESNCLPMERDDFPPAMSFRFVRQYVSGDKLIGESIAEPGKPTLFNVQIGQMAETEWKMLAYALLTEIEIMHLSKFTIDTRTAFEIIKGYLRGSEYGNKDIPW